MLAMGCSVMVKATVEKVIVGVGCCVAWLLQQALLGVKSQGLQPGVQRGLGESECTCVYVVGVAKFAWPPSEGMDGTPELSPTPPDGVPPHNLEPSVSAHASGSTYFILRNP